MKKTRNRMTISFFLIVVPLLIGLLIYVTLDRRSFLSLWLSEHFLFIDSLKIQGVNPFSSFLRNYVCDICWAFSLESCIALMMPTGRNRVRFSILISEMVAVGLELIQICPWMSGTFDLLDLLFETIAISVAGLILYFLLTEGNQ